LCMMFGEPYRNNVVDMFHSSINGLKSVDYEGFEKSVVDSLPDSSDVVIVDTGSAFGRFFTIPLAKKKSHTNFVMVDNFGIDELKDDYLYKSFPGFEGFQTKVVLSGDVQDSMNRLLNANGYANVNYINRLLVPSSSSNLPEIANLFRGKKVVFTGWKNTKSLGFMTNDEAYFNGADCVISTWTALEKSLPGDYIFSRAKDLVGNHFSDAEFSSIKGLLMDQRVDKVGEKFNYKHDGERAFATGLKQLFYLAGCLDLRDKGYSVELLVSDKKFHSFNQADHIIYAYKNDNILKL
jgi:hypothetical protein